MFFCNYFRFLVGLSGCKDDSCIRAGGDLNYYAIETGTDHKCFLAGKSRGFQLPADGIRQKHKGSWGNNVYGCGLLVDPNNELAIFFTLNGILMGQFLYGHGHIFICSLSICQRQIRSLGKLDLHAILAIDKGNESREMVCLCSREKNCREIVNLTQGEKSKKSKRYIFPNELNCRRQI
jgi:hypothetical protein